MVVCAAITACFVASVRGQSSPAGAADRVWFAPGPGTLDYLRLFDHPEEWSHARAILRVFKFYNQHLQTAPAPIVGPNTYDALVRAGAFRKLRMWHIKTALEIGSVKEFFCTPDGSGMTESIRSTIESINRVQAAGGVLDYLSQDEPFAAGRAAVCGGPALEPTADRVAQYMTAVQRAFPQLRIGLIEAYPLSSADAIERMLQLLRARGVPPAFLHIDVDRRALRPGDFARDLPRLQAATAAEKISFGVIIWGYDGDADSIYALDAAAMSDLIADAFKTWDAMPDHIVVQSWAQTTTGLFITPSNLPEDRLYTHTNLLSQFFRTLRGSTGGPIGKAVPRTGGR